MDNHLAAAWCWAQAIKPNESYDFVHIDRHYDALDSPLPVGVHKLPSDLSTLSLEAYEAVRHPNCRDTPYFRWDNYIWAFEQVHPKAFATQTFATHKQGTAPKWPYEPSEPWQIIGALDWMASEKARRIVLNLDLDYFVCPGLVGSIDFFSSDYRLALYSTISELRGAELIAVMTVSLSPECCGGWPRAEKLCAELASALALDLTFPP